MVLLLIIIGLVILFLVISLFLNKTVIIDSLAVADIIERFIEGKGKDWEWDDFISSPIRNPLLEKIRVRCLELNKEFPPIKSGQYTNEKGLEILQQYVTQLRKESEIVR